MSDVSKPEYWAGRYQRGEIGWDKGTVAPPFVRLVDDGVLKKGAKVLVIGAGYGHEAVFLAERGFAVTAVDFAEPAVARLRQTAAEKGLSIEVLQADVLTLGKTHAGAFDGVLEHACFCAIDPSSRQAYVETMAAVLKPHGCLFGLFFVRQKEGGPPFSTTEEELRALFARKFRFEAIVPPPDSFPARQGEELEVVLWKR